MACKPSRSVEPILRLRGRARGAASRAGAALLGGGGFLGGRGRLRRVGGDRVLDRGVDARDVGVALVEVGRHDVEAHAVAAARLQEQVADVADHALGNVGLDDLLERIRDRTDLAEQIARGHGRDHGLLQLPLALHAREVGGLVAGPGVPERRRAVHVLLPDLDVLRRGRPSG
ncbi:hypothetical protein ACFPRL_11565 [Pseudoclavibacter helvolus]